MKIPVNIFLIAGAGISILLALILMKKSDNSLTNTSDNSSLTITSNSFENGAAIPQQYTCDGENISPQLQWNSVQNVGSYVLIVDDPDAQRVVGKTFVHWIVAMPPAVQALPEGISSANGSSLEKLESIARELTNDFGKTVYGGPCPRAGSGMHTYRFTLFAVKEDVDAIANTLTAPFTAEKFEEAKSGLIIAQARLTGTYIS